MIAGKQAPAFVCSLPGGPLDGHTSFTLWGKEVKVQLPEYGLPGFAVIKGIPYIHPVPDPFGKL